MGVGGHQPHAGQAAGDQVGEEGVPRGCGLAGGNLHAEDFAVAVTVDPGVWRTISATELHHSVGH
jgi:hypothetical protein